MSLFDGEMRDAVLHIVDVNSTGVVEVMEL